MGRKKILNTDMPDEEFEAVFFRELDSSRIREQFYLGVYTITNKTMANMVDGEESVRYPYRKERTTEEMFEKDYISHEEKNSITEQNMKLIDKCVGDFMPRSKEDKKLFCIEDVVEACYEGFIAALDEYPREASTAKFSTYAYTLMANSCRDMIKRQKAKKRGLPFIDSLDEPIASGSSKEEGEATIGDLIGVNMNDEDTDENIKRLTMESFIVSVFKGMDKESVLILTYRFGVGNAGYEHTEAEISDILGLPPALIRRKMDAAMEEFKMALYSQGLLSEAEAILVGDMGYSKNHIREQLAETEERYIESFDIDDDDASIVIGSEDPDSDDEPPMSISVS